MAKPTKIKGVIFDVDGTLLNEYPGGVGLHERARLAATHRVGKQRDIPALQAFTIEHAHEAFANAKEHSLRGAVWQSLLMMGMVDSQDIDPTHPLLVELIQLKDELFENILRTDGGEIPGASAFVRTLAASGMADQLAIASTACRRDIDVFLEMTSLTPHFPDARIISIERITNPKPHPEAFDRAFQTLGLPESHRPFVLAFEDHPRGIASAKAAGLFTCAITTLHNRDTLTALDVAPDLIADSFEEFQQLLELSHAKHKARL